VALLCRPWCHCSLNGGSLTILYMVALRGIVPKVSIVAFVIISWFLGASYPR
jgi:hypothetical protein